MLVDALVEGPLDEAVARRLIEYCGHTLGTAYGKQGIDYLRRKLAGYNEHARHGNPMLVLVDFMDTRLNCPPELPTIWLPNRCTRLLLRAVVREAESWLLADAAGIADFLAVSASRVPRHPELEPDPKRTLVQLARRSRRRAIRAALVPPEGVSSTVGPDYNRTLKEFVRDRWDVRAAVERAPSLARCLTRLRDLHQLPQWPEDAPP